jgi:hypothetical protein
MFSPAALIATLVDCCDTGCFLGSNRFMPPNCMFSV